MRTTMMHFDKALSDAEREQLCGQLQATGVSCETEAHSAKPHLLFVAYDETTTSPGTLAHIAEQAGYHAQVVDM